MSVESGGDCFGSSLGPSNAAAELRTCFAAALGSQADKPYTILTCAYFRWYL
jgi:hypothetical protein